MPPFVADILKKLDIPSVIGMAKFITQGADYSKAEAYAADDSAAKLTTYGFALVAFIIGLGAYHLNKYHSLRFLTNAYKVLLEDGGWHYAWFGFAACICSLLALFLLVKRNAKETREWASFDSPPTYFWLGFFIVASLSVSALFGLTALINLGLSKIAPPGKAVHFLLYQDLTEYVVTATIAFSFVRLCYVRFSQLTYDRMRSERRYQIHFLICSSGLFFMTWLAIMFSAEALGSVQGNPGKGIVNARETPPSVLTTAMACTHEESEIECVFTLRTTDPQNYSLFRIWSTREEDVSTEQTANNDVKWTVRRRVGEGSGMTLNVPQYSTMDVEVSAPASSVCAAEWSKSSGPLLKGFKAKGRYNARWQVDRSIINLDISNPNTLRDEFAAQCALQKA